MTNDRPAFSVLLPAAGAGSRFGVVEGGRTKVQHRLGCRPLWHHAAAVFAARPDVVEVLVLVPQPHLAQFQAEAGDLTRCRFIAGSPESRTQTIRRGLREVSASATHVAVHDAARPNIPPDLVQRVFDAAVRHGAAIPGVPVRDTLARVGSSQPDPLGRLVDHVDRDRVVAVQTPQAARADWLKAAYNKFPPEAAATDDAGVLQQAGYPVYVVPGDPANLKITQPGDEVLLEALMRPDGDDPAEHG